MRRWLSLLTVLVTSLSTPQAFALKVVDYDLSTSSLTLSSPGGLFTPVSIPPQGSLLGKIEISYTSDIAGDILNGPATLDIVNVSGNLNISTNTIAGPFTATGPAAGQLDAPVQGMVSGSNGTTGTGATINFGANQGIFTGSTTITCGGTALICNAIKAPAGVPTLFSGMGVGPIPNLTLGSIHGDFPSFGFAFGLGSLSSELTIAFSLGGQVVPEPSSVLLLASGLAGLALKRRFRVLH